MIKDKHQTPAKSSFESQAFAKVNRMKEYNKEYSIKDIWNHLESRTMQEWPCNGNAAQTL